MYRLTDTEGWIYKLDDKLFIPPDDGNIDYQAYLRWIDEGNEPEPWGPPDSPN